MNEKERIAVRALCEAYLLMECIYKLSSVLKDTEDVICEIKDAVWFRLNFVSPTLSKMWEKAAWPPEEIDTDAEMAKND